MASSIQSIIESETQPIEALRLDASFVVPIYQRPFEWERQMVRRFVRDLFHGAVRLGGQPNRINFIGSMITASVPAEDQPSLGSPPAGRPFTLVDGQQRFACIILLAVALRDALMRGMKQQPLDNTIAVEAWLQPHVMEVVKRLRDLAVVEMLGAAQPYQPRLIRLSEDRWSHGGDSQFRSPIADLVSQYISSSNFEMSEDATGPFKYSAPDEDFEELSSEVGDYRYMEIRYDDVYQLVNWLSAGERGRDDGIPDPSEFTTDEFKENGWFQAFGLTASPEFRPQLIAYISDLESKQPDGVPGLFRLFVVAKYLLSRTVVSWAKAHEEDHALEMFDALNTMGTPLTALACFKPRVVASYESTEAFRASTRGKQFRAVESILGQESGSERRRRMARDLVSAYLLAENGSAPGNKLPDQRTGLREAYSRAEGHSPDAADDSLLLLKHTAQVMFELWPQPVRLVTEAPGEPLANEAGMALAVLSESGHTVVQGLLARFYHALRADELSQSDWFRLVRALAAFWIFWRTANEGRYPDAFYRGLIGGVPAAEWAGFKRHGGAQPELSVLVERMKSVLEDINAHTADAWIESALEAPIYDRQRHVSKAILLAASHHRAAHPEKNGALQDTKKAEDLAWLRWKRWSSEELTSVEHIAPVGGHTIKEEGEAAWDTAFYIGQRVHEIGNLTLLPISENSAISDRPWTQKRVIYKALTQVTPHETKAVLDTEGSDLPEEVRQAIVNRDTYASLPVLGSLTGYGDFALAASRGRGRHILGCAYETLSGWLSASSPEQE